MRLLSAIAALAIVAGAVAVSPDALAQRNRNQSASVVVVNYQRVLSESALGRDMSTKLQTVRGQVTQEAQALAPEGQSIEQERARLAQASRNMTADQIRNSSTLNPQFQALQQRVEQFQRRGQELQGDFECSQYLALRDFDRQLTPIVRSAMEARGAGVVLDAGNVQFTAPEYDITTTVIQQLDQAARTANVTRHPVADCQTQNQTAAPAAQ